MSCVMQHYIAWQKLTYNECVTSSFTKIKMEPRGSSYTSLNFYLATWCNIQMTVLFINSIVQPLGQCTWRSK